MDNGLTRCQYGVGGHTSPMTCSQSREVCPHQRYCIHDHIYKHTSSASHCKDYTPKVKK